MRPHCNRYWARRLPPMPKPSVRRRRRAGGCNSPTAAGFRNKWVPVFILKYSDYHLTVMRDRQGREGKMAPGSKLGKLHYGWIIVVVGSLVIFSCIGLARYAYT